MQRTDRLFEIIHILRKAKAPLRAQDIADQLEVTPRTVYRYISTLQSMRIPIEGSTGIGYVMRGEYDLPPLNFAQDELEAIVVGLGLLNRTGDKSLQNAALRVLNKIETSSVSTGSLRVSDWGVETVNEQLVAHIRKAIHDEQVLDIKYKSETSGLAKRTILPIILTYFTEVVVVSAWCNLRQDFRNFRIDRISKCDPLDAYFTGKSKKLRKEFDAQNAPP